MATTTYVPVEQYLRSSFEPDAEYVDGEIEERPAGELDHASWQGAVAIFFSLRRREKEWNIRALISLTVQVAPTRFRVPDVAVLEDKSSHAKEQIIRTPPLAVFEILSPEDRLVRTMVKLHDYEAMGVRTIVVIDPKGPKYRYEHGCLELLEQTTLALSGSKCVVDFAEIEKLLQ